MPQQADLLPALSHLGTLYPIPLKPFPGDFAEPAAALAGATLSSIETLLQTRQHHAKELTPKDLVALKKDLVEKDAQGLIEFVKPDRTLDDLHGQDAIKAWLRQDIALWRAGDLAALPMGYLFCGPVGTGKTFMVECLAGEAGVPVVKMKNFRDKWVGSTESNLEKIFRLLDALGRCIVFVDEADQALGRRNADSGDSGVSGPRLWHDGRTHERFAQSRPHPLGARHQPPGPRRGGPQTPRPRRRENPVVSHRHPGGRLPTDPRAGQTPRRRPRGNAARWLRANPSPTCSPPGPPMPSR